MNKDANTPPPSRRPPSQPYTPPFFAPQRSQSTVHYTPSPPGSALALPSVYPQNPAFIRSTYIQPQMYSYLSLPQPPQSDGLLHTIHTPVYRSVPQHPTPHYPYHHRLSPEAASLTSPSQSSPHHSTNDPNYAHLPNYSYPQNAPQIYQTTYIPTYSQAYYRDNSLRDNASTWWYYNQSTASPRPSYESPVPLQRATPSAPPSLNPSELALSDTTILDQQTGSLSLAGQSDSISGQRKGAKSTVQPLQPQRRPFHPNPPVNRSEWVMWVGNVPSDATHDELWRFFNGDTRQVETHSKDHLSSPMSQASSHSLIEGGVVSVFPIPRSNCAFVNFDTEARLQKAVVYFNGKTLRPEDDRCPKLLCRIRRPDDDLKAGVGGQRGMGMHIKWIRDKRQMKEAESEMTRQSSTLAIVKADNSSSSELSLASSSGRPTQNSSTSSGSYASTTSSFLSRYFAKRYFILKSLNVVPISQQHVKAS